MQDPQFPLMVATLSLFEQALSKPAQCPGHFCGTGKHPIGPLHGVDEHEVCARIEDDLWAGRIICRACDDADEWRGRGTVEGLVGRR